MLSNTLTADTDLATPYRELLERLNLALAKRHFFIVGCQKSGTTWVQRLLDGHDNLRCHGEAYFGAVMLPLLKQVQQVHNQRHKAGELGTFTDDDLLMLFSAAVALPMSRWINEKEDVAAIGEKTPERRTVHAPARCDLSRGKVHPRHS